ncbi:hypothetical protein WJX81_007824 [Elliptochloris bilobata]|uniref:3'-5' exonuclease n=1 Tax=Elliptochloris bilobata TaxID=381761 RepID=A0AAW1RGE8_9CHLO
MELWSRSTAEQVSDRDYLALDEAIAHAERRAACPPSGKRAERSGLAPCKRRLTAAASAPACAGVRRLPESLSRVQLASCSRAEQAPADAHLPPLSFCQGRMLYASTPSDVDQLCWRLLSLGVAVVGFDIEWRVTFKAGATLRRTAVIQLCYQVPQGGRGPGAAAEAPGEQAAGPCASAPEAHGAPGAPERASGRGCECLILHVARSGITSQLSALLSSPDLAKAGVGISGDAQKLARDYPGLACAGAVCLSELANQRLSSASRPPERWSLARLTAEVLFRRLDKRQALRMSNWEAVPLTAAQRAYASADAFASLRLLQALEAMPQAPEAPAGQAGLWRAASDAGCGPALLVPAAASQAPLQPAKMTVWRLHAEQGLSGEAIAMLRSIQVDSVQGYIAEAVTAGWPYIWHRLGVPPPALALVALVARRAASQAQTLPGAAGQAVPALWQGAPLERKPL